MSSLNAIWQIVYTVRDDKSRRSRVTLWIERETYEYTSTMTITPENDVLYFAWTTWQLLQQVITGTIENCTISTEIDAAIDSLNVSEFDHLSFPRVAGAESEYLNRYRSADPTSDVEETIKLQFDDDGGKRAFTLMLPAIAADDLIYAGNVDLTNPDLQRLILHLSMPAAQQEAGIAWSIAPIASDGRPINRLARAWVKYNRSLIRRRRR